MRFMMKKFVLVWGLISLLSINNCFAEEQFVNPIFNKTLYAYSRTSWNTLLTLSSITQSPDNFSDSDAYIEKHSCELLENEFDHIKYKCNLCYQAFLKKKKHVLKRSFYLKFWMTEKFKHYFLTRVNITIMAQSILL